MIVCLLVLASHGSCAREVIEVFSSNCYIVDELHSFRPKLYLENIMMFWSVETGA